MGSAFAQTAYSYILFDTDQLSIEAKESYSVTRSYSEIKHKGGKLPNHTIYNFYFDVRYIPDGSNHIYHQKFKHAAMGDITMLWHLQRQVL